MTSTEHDPTEVYRGRVGTDQRGEDLTKRDATPAVDDLVDFEIGAGDTDRRSRIRPMTVRIGGQSFTLQAPDMGTVMEIEEARTTRAQLMLIFDEQWPDVEPLVERIDDAGDIARLVRQYGRHFEIDQDSLVTASAPSRSERRRARRGRR